MDLREVYKTYALGKTEVPALRGISFRVEPQEFVAVMGPSGSGKSTLMNILGALDRPTRGAYHLDGQDVSAMSDNQLAEIRNRRIGFVFQMFNLLPRLNALRNVQLPLVYAGVGAAERRRRALEAAERAVRLAPDQPDGHVWRAALRSRFLLDWQGALADAERARALGPGNPAAAQWQGSLLADLGRLPEACRVLEQATELDPFSAQAWTLLGRAQVSSRDHRRARAALGRALEISPRADLAANYLCVDLIACREPERALVESTRAASRWVTLTCAALANHDLARAGDSDAALAALVQGYSTNAAYQIAEVHAWRGEAHLALDWLERARSQADTGMGWIKTDPLLESLRGEPRYLALLRALNLPVD